jgi:hypothetical protein
MDVTKIEASCECRVMISNVVSSICYLVLISVQSVLKLGLVSFPSFPPAH